MHIIDNKLKERQAANNPIKVAVVGTGEMGKGLINQITRYTPGMKVVCAYNRSIEKAMRVFEMAGIIDFKIAKKAEDLEPGGNFITDDVGVILDSQVVDVVVEMTGQITFGLQVILETFKKGKSVVSFNAELEATFGPLLRSKAKESGVGYTLADGDQPGVTLNLYRQVKAMGFIPQVCGNIKGLLDNHRNPATQKRFADSWGMNAEMATNFADGTKIAFEQAAIANATNMSVAQRGMIGLNSTKHVDELTTAFDLEQIERLGGIVDYVVGAKPGPGVFVYATAQDPFSKKYLDYAKLGKGPLYCFYVPYHLLFFEIAFSIARLFDFDDVTLDARFGLKVGVVAIAKEDLDPGDRIDGIGGFKTYGICENFSGILENNLLPMGIAEGCIVKKALRKDQVITFEDVEFDSNSLKHKAHLEQLRILESESSFSLFC